MSLAIAPLSMYLTTKIPPNSKKEPTFVIVLRYEKKRSGLFRRLVRSKSARLTRRAGERSPLLGNTRRRKTTAFEASTANKLPMESSVADTSHDDGRLQRVSLLA